MIFARICLPKFDSGELSRLLDEFSVDLLQLDVSSPTEMQVGHSGLLGWHDLLPQMAKVHTELYLRSGLRVVSNAGLHGVLDCVGSIADFLVSHGSADLPVSAIRGDNLLPHIQNLFSDNLLPTDSNVLRASVQLGGGPFATAFADGARFVVSGAYDISAPLIGAVIANGLCDWQQSDQLALLAAAAHFEDLAVEVRADGEVELPPSAVQQLSNVQDLGVVNHADVIADYGSVALGAAGLNTLRPSRVRGISPNSVWNAQIVIESGFRAVALVSGPADRSVEMIDHLPSQLRGGHVTCNEYRTAGYPCESEALLRIEYRSTSEAACHDFLQWLQLLLRRRSETGKLVAPRPNVDRVIETISAQIPADVVTVSVDTRPARDWL